MPAPPRFGAEVPSESFGILLEVKACWIRLEPRLRQRIHERDIRLYRPSEECGAAAESMVLQLRDDIVAHLNSTGATVSSRLTEWKIKSITDGINNYLRGKTPAMHGALKDEYEAYWSGFSSYIRMVRNDAGHPTSVDPITDEQVHSALLMFPSMASLAAKLTVWATAP